MLRYLYFILSVGCRCGILNYVKLPVSHRDTVLLVTPSRSPSFSWVMPRSRRSRAMNFPTFS